MNINRPEVSDAQLLKAIEIVTHHVGRRIEKHGRGAFVSHHEGLGVMTEEFKELVDAIQANDEMNYVEEMIDLAVGGIFAVASKIVVKEVSADEGSETENIEQNTPQEVDVDSAAEEARKMMIERAAQSGIVIPR